jgi:hypothetical protein
LDAVKVIMNKRRTLGTLVIALLTALAVAWVILGPGEAPAGQPPLVTVDSTSLETLRSEFNRDSSQPRVIVLLSPT